MGLAVAALVAALTPGCGIHGLSFVQDRRIDIVSPPDRATLALPIEVRWTARDFNGTYAVFIDRSPQPPGKPVQWLVRNEQGCRVQDGCPDEAFLAERDIHTTSATTFTVQRIRDVANAHSNPLHEVTVVLLDSKGDRIGESAFRVQFRVKRKKGF